MSWVVFAVNKYECFNEGKNMVRSFAAVKLPKNKQH